MDKEIIEEMVEELSHDIFDDENETIMELSRHLIAKGWVKIPEGSMLLTNDDIKEFANMFATSPQMKETIEGLIKAWQKETAIEIINEFALSPRTRAMIAEKYGLSKEDLEEV